MSSWIKGGLFTAFTLMLALGVFSLTVENYALSDCGLATDELCVEAAQWRAIITLTIGLALWLGVLWLTLKDWGKH